MKLLICLLLSCLGLPAQQDGPSPPNWRPIGVTLRKQPAHLTQPGPVAGSQVFGVFTDASTSLLPSQNNELGTEIDLTGALWLFAATVEANYYTGALQMSANPQAQTFFSLTVLGGVPFSLPLGMPGHDLMFSESPFLMLPDFIQDTSGAPVWVATQVMNGVNASSAYHGAFKCITIPNDTTLIGMPYSAQSVRFQALQAPPYGPALFASDEIIFTIGDSGEH